MLKRAPLGLTSEPLLVRVSASFGVLLMLIYWMAHMDWPFVENKNNLLFDYHLVYGGVLVYLIVAMVKPEKF